MRSDNNSRRSVCLAVPGTLDTLTGGYIYDRRILAELEQAGWATGTLSLDESFPEPTEAALTQAKSGFERIAAGTRVVIDGLALAGLRPLLPAIVARLDVFALIHHPLADETGIARGRAHALKLAETSALALVPRVIVTSPWTRRRLAAYGVDDDRIAVIEPGIDRPPVNARKAAPTLRLLTVATVTPRKGHRLLIEALAGLKDHDWSLRCVGSLERDRQCADALIRQIDAAGLRDRVSLLGELPPKAVSAEYAAADLFVLPSYLEGYGMVLAEAIAHAVPLVSTTAGAIPDTVPAAAGVLVPPGDADALAETLQRLFTDPAALASLQQGARDAADTVPTWAESGQKFAAALAARESG